MGNEINSSNRGGNNRMTSQRGIQQNKTSKSKSIPITGNVLLSTAGIIPITDEDIDYLESFDKIEEIEHVYNWLNNKYFLQNNAHAKFHKEIGNKALMMSPFFNSLGPTILEFLSVYVDFMPIIGDIKGMIEGITGEDLFTGKRLPTWVRVIGAIPLIGRFAKATKLSNKLSIAGKRITKNNRFLGKIALVSKKSFKIAAGNIIKTVSGYSKIVGAIVFKLVKKSTTLARKSVRNVIFSVLKTIEKISMIPIKLIEKIEKTFGTFKASIENALRFPQNQQLAMATVGNVAGVNPAFLSRAEGQMKNASNASSTRTLKSKESRAVTNRRINNPSGIPPHATHKNYKLKHVKFDQFPDSIPKNTVLVFPGGGKVWKTKNGLTWTQNVISKNTGRRDFEKAFNTSVKEQLAHAAGSGTGFESPYAIVRAITQINQRIQNHGIERFLRKLRNNFFNARSENKLIMTTATKLRPRSIILDEITYQIDIFRVTGRDKWFEFTVKQIPPSTASPSGAILIKDLTMRSDKFPGLEDVGATATEILRPSKMGGVPVKIEL